MMDDHINVSSRLLPSAKQILARKPKPVYLLPLKDGVMGFWYVGDGVYEVTTLRHASAEITESLM